MFDLRFFFTVAQVKVSIGVEWHSRELHLKVLSTSDHVLIELKPLLLGQLFLDYFVDWVLEVLSGQSFHIASYTAVVGSKESLRFFNTFLLEVVVFVVIDPVSAFITLSRFSPGEVLTVRVWFSLVIR